MGQQGADPLQLVRLPAGLAVRHGPEQAAVFGAAPGLPVHHHRHLVPAVVFRLELVVHEGRPFLGRREQLLVVGQPPGRQPADPRHVLAERRVVGGPVRDDFLVRVAVDIARREHRLRVAVAVCRQGRELAAVERAQPVDRPEGVAPARVVESGVQKRFDRPFERVVCPAGRHPGHVSGTSPFPVAFVFGPAHPAHSKRITDLRPRSGAAGGHLGGKPRQHCRKHPKIDALIDEARPQHWGGSETIPGGFQGSRRSRLRRFNPNRPDCRPGYAISPAARGSGIVCVSWR